MRPIHYWWAILAFPNYCRVLLAAALKNELRKPVITRDAVLALDMARGAFAPCA
jgi:hypothetical protein